MPLGICLSRAGSLLLLLLLREVGARELALLLQTPFSRFSSSVDSPQFSPHVKRRGILGESSVSCSRESRSSERGSGWIRGLGPVRLALVDVAVALALSPLTVRGLAVVSVGDGRRPLHALLVDAHAVSGRGLLTAASLSVGALGRVVPGLDPRIDIGHAVTSLGVRGRGLLPAAAPAVSVRVSLPVGGCGAFVRDRTLSRIARLTARGHACDYLLLLPACGPWKQAGWPDVGHRRVWGPLSLSLLWHGAAAGVPPVLEGVHCRSPVCFFQELAKFVMSLSGSSSLGASGVLAGVTASAAASWGIACPASAAAGAATLCAATVTPAGAGVFCLLFLACLVISSVRGSPALAGVAVGRLVMGPTDVLRALQGKVSFFCPLFASSGGGAVALPQIRLWMTDLSLLLPVPGMRLEVRILVALPGILTARLVLGRRGLLQGLSLCQSGARLRPPRPSGVADVAGSFTFAGFRLA